MGSGQSSWVKKKEVNVLCIGLDNSGKSTILNKLKEENYQTMHIVPTIGFSVEQFNFGSFQITAFDMSGQSQYRNLWEHYYGECVAIIFVIDSCDKFRMAVAKEELAQMLKHPKMREKSHLPVLFFANKCDLRNSASAIKVAQIMELDKGEWVKGGSLQSEENGGSGRPWHICSSNALTGDGLSEGLTWLTDQLAKS